jgi:hypothetical protein
MQTDRKQALQWRDEIDRLRETLVLARHAVRYPWPFPEETLAKIDGAIAAATPLPAGQPYYISGPYADGTYSVCEAATMRVLRVFRGYEDLQLAAHPEEQAAGQVPRQVHRSGYDTSDEAQAGYFRQVPQPLSEEQMHALWVKHTDGGHFDRFKLIRAIEAAHGIGRGQAVKGEGS